MSTADIILKAIDDLHDAAALAEALKAMHETGSYPWRVVDVLAARLQEIISRMDQFDTHGQGCRDAG